MALHYGITDKWHVLDDFGYGLAKSSGMVCPVVYKRHPYHFKDDARDLAQLAQVLKVKLKDDDSLSADEIIKSLKTIMIDKEDDEDNDRQSKMSRDLSGQIRRMLEKEAIPERLDAIVCELEKYEGGLEIKDDGTRVFRPRALVFDRDTNNAISIIEYIQSLNKDKPDHELNVYKGWRFGIDVSNFGKDISGVERTFQTLNPGVASESDIKQRLKSLDPDLRIDVLLAVGKYTKGYNNDQLAVVALLRNVAEPSLMNQIYTRPATMREGKAKGVCLDLAFGQGNIYCWKESLKLYDKDVDLNNLLVQEDVDNLVSQVKSGLIKASNTLDITIIDLARPYEIIKLLEQMDENQRRIKIREFILQARDVVGLISKMPDSSIFGTLKSPLIGLRVTLANLQHLYPDLVEDQSINLDGSVDGGFNSQYLGDIIRQALEVLKASSLKNLFENQNIEDGDSATLKGFLGIQMGSSFVVESFDDEDTEFAIKQVRARQAILATASALEAVVGDDKDGKKSRALRSSAVLLEALNRALDKLRDENPSIQQQHQALIQAHKALSDWASKEQDQSDGMLGYFIFEALSLLADQRAQMLSLSSEVAGLDSNGLLSNVIEVAKEDIAQNYKMWFKGLSEQWANQEPQRLVRAWRTQYTSLSLTDFLVKASKRSDLHGLEQAQWLDKLRDTYPSEQTRQILGLSGNNDQLNDLPPLIDRALEIALERQNAIMEASAWSKNLGLGDK